MSKKCACADGRVLTYGPNPGGVGDYDCNSLRASGCEGCCSGGVATDSIIREGEGPGSQPYITSMASSGAIGPASAVGFDGTSNHPCQNGGSCKCGGKCKKGYSNIAGVSDVEVGRIMSRGAYLGTIGGLIASYMYLGLWKDKTKKKDLFVAGAITLLGLGIGSYWSARVVDNKSKNI